MNVSRTIALAAALAAAAVTASTTSSFARHSFMSGHVDEDSLRSGPDSARVAGLLATLGSGEPLVCEMIADQVGNFWFGGNDDGVGRFADARMTLDAAKDSLHGRIAAEGTIRLLVGTLNSENPCVRRVAAKWLGRSRADSVRLTQLLSDASPRVREAAAYAIGNGHDRLHGALSRLALERMLRDRGANEAAMAAWALGEIQDSASVPALEGALRSTDARVRIASIDALGEIKDTHSLKELERILKNDASAPARAHAAQAVGEIGEEASLGVLAAALIDASPEVQYAAVEAIENLDDISTAPPALVKATQSSDTKLARMAALALAEIHDPATLDALLALITHSDEEVRKSVAEALGNIGSPKASNGLMRLLKDPNAEVRRAAVEALGEINKES